MLMDDKKKTTIGNLNSLSGTRNCG